LAMMLVMGATVETMRNGRPDTTSPEPHGLVTVLAAGELPPHADTNIAPANATQMVGFIREVTALFITHSRQLCVHEC